MWKSLQHKTIPVVICCLAVIVFVNCQENDVTTTLAPNTTLSQTAGDLNEKLGAEETSAETDTYGFSTNDLKGWVAPDYLVKNYPFYLSGYDFERRPIWIAEFGKFDMRGLVEKGQKSKDDFHKYVKKFIKIVLKSREGKATPDHPVDSVVVIIDFDGLQILQLLHPQTIVYCLQLLRDYRYLLDSYAHKVYIINANAVAGNGLNIAKPILGGILDRFEIFGTNKERWIPRFREEFPKDQIPEWYGGSKGHTPLQIFG